MQNFELLTWSGESEGRASAEEDDVWKWETAGDTDEGIYHAETSQDRTSLGQSDTGMIPPPREPISSEEGHKRCVHLSRFKFPDVQKRDPDGKQQHD